MAKFRCKASGNVIEFIHKHDIDSMVGHDGYEEVTDTGDVILHEKPEKIIPFTPPVGVAPQRGRPKKAA